MALALRIDPGFEREADPAFDPGLGAPPPDWTELELVELDGTSERPRRVQPPRPVRKRATTRTRTHGGVTARSGASRRTRPMVRATAGITVVAPAHLFVVPTRRRAARFVGVGFAVVFVLMLGAAAFQTQLARRQVELDKIDRSIRDANEQYSRLRLQRAELRAPAHLVTEASKLGMVPAEVTTFVPIDPDVVAEVQRSAGGVFDAGSGVTAIDEYAAVKHIAGAAP